MSLLKRACGSSKDEKEFGKQTSQGLGFFLSIEIVDEIDRIRIEDVTQARRNPNQTMYTLIGD